MSQWVQTTAACTHEPMSSRKSRPCDGRSLAQVASLAQVVPLRRSQGISYDAMCLSQTFPAAAYTSRSSCFIFASDRPSFRS